MGVDRGASLESIEQVYRACFDDFVRTASAISNSLEGGRDAVHDAFVAAVRTRRRYRGEGTVEAWIWRIVVNSALKRRRRGEIAAGDGELLGLIWAESRDDETVEIRAAVAALPERQRLVLFLRYYGDLAYQAIADAAGIQIGTVGAELHAAHRSLRRHLEEVLTHE
jgi:RNA polymerase sigma-70 factor (ECF subfamily)